MGGIVLEIPQNEGFALVSWQVSFLTLIHIHRRKTIELK